MYLLDFVLPEVWYGIDNDPRQRTPKVDDLVQNERHDTSREDVIAHELVP